MNRSRRHFLGVCSPITLSQSLIIPEDLQKQKIKCRVTYSNLIENIEYEPYINKKIESLKLIQADAIAYSFKFKNRDSLIDLLKQRGEMDEILMVRSGFITDTSFTNIVFLQNGYWYTPAMPMLAGTRREDYLKNCKIFPRNIRPSELKYYEEARLINAMRSLENAEPILIEQIRW